MYVLELRNVVVWLRLSDGCQVPQESNDTETRSRHAGHPFKLNNVICGYERHLLMLRCNKSLAQLVRLDKQKEQKSQNHWSEYAQYEICVRLCDDMGN